MKFGFLKLNNDAAADNVGSSTSSSPLGGVALPDGRSLPSTDKLRSFVSDISDQLKTGVSNVKEKVSSARDDLETHKELPSRVDGLQVTVDELQKRLDTIEPMLNNLNIDFKMLLDVFTTNFNSTQPPANYDVFKENMSKQMRNILAAIYKREQSVTG